MTIHLPENLERSILAEVHSGHFASVDDAMAEAVRLLLRQERRSEAGTVTASQATPAATDSKAIWEVFQEISAGVPDEIWDALPTDLSEEHDHYIYGTPKRSER